MPVFVNRKQSAEDTEARLKAVGVKCGALHGDMDQSSRQAALTAFKQGRVHVLIATDLAARGLDVPTARGRRRRPAVHSRFRFLFVYLFILCV